jgi:regulatory protein
LEDEQPKRPSQESRTDLAAADPRPQPAAPPSQDADDERLQEALGFAYRYLNRRDRTVSEMRRHLKSRGCLTAEIDGAIRLLAEQRYLDDERFARLFVEDKRTLEQWGADRIQGTLERRGIDRELVQQALASEAPDGELARALALLKRRFPTPPVERHERERALGVLLRKGYEGELALEALMAYADCADSPPVLRCW